MTLYLGLDVGTQGTKGVVLDADGSVVAEARAAYGLIEGLPAGAAEQHPHTWRDAIRTVAERLAGSVDRWQEVAAVGVSGQQHGLVVLDAAGEVVRPAKLWCDTSTASEAAELSAALGRPIPTGFTAPKILWLQRNEPEAWARVRTAFLPHDWVNFILTGARIAEAGDASGTGYFDAATRTWDAAAVAMLGIEDVVPAVVDPPRAAGCLSESGAALLGLAAGLPVAPGSGDNMMSALGAGAAEPGLVVVSLGTSGTVFTCAEAPVVDPDGGIAGFCDATGRYLPLLCTMNMTAALEEVVRAFPGEDHASLTAAADTVDAGSDGVLFVPYLAGERVPDLPDAWGAFTRLRPGLLRSGRLYRAAMEGVTLGLGRGVDRMRALGVDFDRARAVGGGAVNDLWMRILASVLDVTVEVSDDSESAALGAAIQARWTARVLAGEGDLTIADVARDSVRAPRAVVAPEPAAVEIYREGRARLGDLTARLF